MIIIAIIIIMMVLPMVIMTVDLAVTNGYTTALVHRSTHLCNSPACSPWRDTRRGEPSQHFSCSQARRFRSLP
jgi:hypothetical protein